MNSTRGVASLLVIGVIAAITGLAWLVKPSLFPGASKRAAESQQATAKLAAATTEAEAAAKKQGAEAAASVATIGAANATAPDSKEKDFIRQEVPVALSKLPAPDPVALLSAEQRKTAVLTGQLEESRALYATEYKHAADLSAAIAKAQAERDAALAARRDVDLRLSEAAAAAHARTVQAMAALGLVVLLGGALAYVKLMHLGPNDLRHIVTDIRAGADPIAAIDGRLLPAAQNKIQKLIRLATPVK